MKKHLKIFGLSAIALAILGGFLALGLVPSSQAAEQEPGQIAQSAPERGYATRVHINATYLPGMATQDARIRSTYTYCDLVGVSGDPNCRYLPATPQPYLLPDFVQVNGDRLTVPAVGTFSCTDIPAAYDGVLEGPYDFEAFVFWVLDKHVVPGTNSSVPKWYIQALWDHCGGDSVGSENRTRGFLNAREYRFPWAERSGTLPGWARCLPSLPGHSAQCH